MLIEPIAAADAMWHAVAEYAERCSWRAGASLAGRMRAGEFAEWERVFVALEGERVAGYCTLSATDCIPDAPYTPYIGYVFVDERFRGARLSQRLICAAMDYARALGFERVYLVSDHVNLYEKYGFVGVASYPAPWNPNQIETVFMHAL